MNKRMNRSSIGRKNFFAKQNFYLADVSVKNCFFFFFLIFLHTKFLIEFKYYIKVKINHWLKQLIVKKGRTKILFIWRIYVFVYCFACTDKKRVDNSKFSLNHLKAKNEDKKQKIDPKWLKWHFNTRQALPWNV